MVYVLTCAVHASVAAKHDTIEMLMYETKMSEIIEYLTSGVF